MCVLELRATSLHAPLPVTALIQSTHAPCPQRCRSCVQKPVGLKAAACLLNKGKGFVAAAGDGSVHVSYAPHDAFLRMDAAAVRALNLFAVGRDAIPVPSLAQDAAAAAALAGGAASGAPKAASAKITGAGFRVTSVHGLLSHGCKTKGGKRLLRTWLLQPLRDLATIAARQDMVEAFTTSNQLRRSWSEGLALPDLESLAARFTATQQQTAAAAKASAAKAGAASAGAGADADADADGDDGSSSASAAAAAEKVAAAASSSTGSRKGATLADLMRLYQFALTLPDLARRLRSFDPALETLGMGGSSGAASSAAGGAASGGGDDDGDVGMGGASSSSAAAAAAGATDEEEAIAALSPVAQRLYLHFIQPLQGYASKMEGLVKMVEQVRPWRPWWLTAWQ